MYYYNHFDFIALFTADDNYWDNNGAIRKYDSDSKFSFKYKILFEFIEEFQFLVDIDDVRNNYFFNNSPIHNNGSYSKISC